MNSIRRITNRSVGQFDPKNWINEGGGLLASAKVVREHWADYKKTFNNSFRSQKSRRRDSAPDRNLLTGPPRSSMLLLGYSVEMYLKAGLTKAYLHCSEEMFERDVKKRFGHKLVSLAEEINFDFKIGDKANFKRLMEMMLFDARYPIFVSKDQCYTDEVNQQTKRIWRIENVDPLYALAERVRGHVRSIDNDSKNPMTGNSWNVDQDGYFAFRVGGHLQPRITYRVSSAQVEAGIMCLNDMKKLYTSEKYLQLNRLWDSAWIYQDHGAPKGKTIRVNP